LDAYVPPALFDNATSKAGMAPRTRVAEAAFRNKAFGECQADAARNLAAKNRSGV
jgi:hypothetical protein